MTHVCQFSVQRIHQKCLPHIQVERREIKILEGMKKACANTITIWGTWKCCISSQISNEQMECNVNIEIVRRGLKVVGFEAQVKTRSFCCDSRTFVLA